MKPLRSYLFLILLLGSSMVGAESGDEVPPNIVLIFADDLGYGDLSSYGATKLKTPNIDKLAREGKRFTDAHSASAVCTPSRYAMMTGEYPHRGRHYAPVFLKAGLIIDPERQTMASILKHAGYDTACIGKWHLGFGEDTPDWNGDLKPGPLELGFDYYFGVPTVNSHPPFVYVENHRVVGLLPDDPFVYGERAKTAEIYEKLRLDDIGGAEAAHALYRDEFVGTTLTEKATQWIEDRDESPFFLYLSTTNIHHPFTPHPRFVGTSECGLYGDFVHELDWIVGEVMHALEAKGVADNTLVIFTSDNGGMFNHTGQKAWDQGHELNGPLLGFKFDAWEGGHRVPFIARWPGRIAAGSESDALICNVDMIRTFSALTGQDLAAGQGQDSVNLLPTLLNEVAVPTRDHLLLSPFRANHLALRKGKWMYIDGQLGGGFNSPKPGMHAFGGPAALAYSGRENSNFAEGEIRPEAPPAQLYDLDADPGQTKNVYSDHPEIVAELSALIRSY
ncbi:arylsulfatase [Opitutaceae bacterium]|nr:arylsulfatase [bacterium]MDB4384962.1 arylsulfatase [Opitutaceae bacterium]